MHQRHQCPVDGCRPFSNNTDLSRMKCAVASSLMLPNVMVPRHTLQTSRSLEPNLANLGMDDRSEHGSTMNVSIWLGQRNRLNSSWSQPIEGGDLKLFYVCTTTMLLPTHTDTASAQLQRISLCRMFSSGLTIIGSYRDVMSMRQASILSVACNLDR